MYCKSCGQKIDDDSRFCSYCGVRQSLEFNSSIHINSEKQNLSEDYRAGSNSNKFEKVIEAPKYDVNYSKESDAAIVGMLLLIVAFILAFLGPFEFSSREAYGQFRTFTTLASVAIRIAVTIWVVNIAKRQNRDSTAWGLFAFLLPSIALIIIGNTKKLYAQIQLIDWQDDIQNSKMLSSKAENFFSNKKYFESKRFSEKALELDPNNNIASEILRKSITEVVNITNQNSKKQTVYRETTENILLKIISNPDQTIGAEVFVDELPAPDGVYYYKSGTHKLVVEKGKIKERYFIERIKNLVLEKSFEHGIKKGDKVYLLDGNPAPSGRYKMGFLFSKMNVKDGVFVGYD